MPFWRLCHALVSHLQNVHRKGPFGAGTCKGKTMLELGSGVGLAGIAAAMLGCHTTLTDVADVLPLLRKNVAGNFGNAQWAQQVALRERSGSLSVQELDWTKPLQLAAFEEFDYVIGADCVYHEALVQDLLRVLLHVASCKTHGAPTCLNCMFVRSLWYMCSGAPPCTAVAVCGAQCPSIWGEIMPAHL